MTGNELPSYTNSPAFVQIVQALGSDAVHTAELVSAVQRIAGFGKLREILNCITTHNVRTAKEIAEILMRNRKRPRQVSQIRRSSTRKARKSSDDELTKIRAALGVDCFEASDFILQVTSLVPAASLYQIRQCIVKLGARTPEAVASMLTQPVKSPKPKRTVRHVRRTKPPASERRSRPSRFPRKRYVWNPDTGSIESLPEKD